MTILPPSWNALTSVNFSVKCECNQFASANSLSKKRVRTQPQQISLPCVNALKLPLPILLSNMNALSLPQFPVNLAAQHDRIQFAPANFTVKCERTQLAPPNFTATRERTQIHKSGCKRRQNLIFIYIKLINIVILVGNKCCNKKNHIPDFLKNMKL